MFEERAYLGVGKRFLGIEGGREVINQLLRKYDLTLEQGSYLSALDWDYGYFPVKVAEGSTKKVKGFEICVISEKRPTAERTKDDLIGIILSDLSTKPQGNEERHLIEVNPTLLLNALKEIKRFIPDAKILAGTYKRRIK